jgi:hypothetical protein
MREEREAYSLRGFLFYPEEVRSSETSENLTYMALHAKCHSCRNLMSVAFLRLVIVRIVECHEQLFNNEHSTGKTFLTACLFCIITSVFYYFHTKFEIRFSLIDVHKTLMERYSKSIYEYIAVTKIKHVSSCMENSISQAVIL